MTGIEVQLEEVKVGDLVTITYTGDSNPDCPEFLEARIGEDCG